MSVSKTSTGGTGSTTPAEIFPIATEHPALLATQPAFGAYRVVAGLEPEHVATVRALSRVFRLPSGSFVSQSQLQKGSDALLGDKATITIGALRGDGSDVVVSELNDSALVGVGTYKNHDVVFASPFTSTSEHPLLVMYDVVTKSLRSYSQGSIESGVDFAAISGDTIVARDWSEVGAITSHFSVTDGESVAGFATFESSNAGNAPERVNFALSPDGRTIAFLEAAGIDAGGQREWDLVTADVVSGVDQKRVRIGTVASTWLSFDGRWAVITRIDLDQPDRALPSLVVDLDASLAQPRRVDAAIGFTVLDPLAP